MTIFKEYAIFFLKSLIYIHYVIQSFNSCKKHCNLNLIVMKSPQRGTSEDLKCKAGRTLRYAPGTAFQKKCTSSFITDAEINSAV